MDSGWQDISTKDFLKPLLALLGVSPLNFFFTLAPKHLEVRKPLLAFSPKAVAFVFVLSFSSKQYMPWPIEG